jgi:hypothetical protein
MLVVMLAAAPARADLPPLDPNADYAIDAYSGAALGTARIVSMGGAAIANAEGSAGTVANPAAAAVRPATSTSRFDWDWHLDGQQAIYASDLDNNGRDRGGGAQLATFGILLAWRSWAVALVTTTQSTELGGAAQTIDASASRARFAIAHALAGDEVTIGLAIDGGTFSLARGDGIERTTLFELSGSGALAGGAVWREPYGNWRAGMSASLPVTSSKAQVDCDSCGVLPARVVAPGQVGVGVAYRWGDTPWNQLVVGDFRDERAVTVAADLIASGWVANGIGLEAFGEGLEQRSGERIAVSARAGVEWEVTPGKARVRGGVYWEPGRFEGVGGRPHLTLGLEVGGLEFHFLGRHRLRVSLTADLAPRYGTASLSLGFWH